MQKENGFKYYEYVLVYVDDILILSHQPKTTMDAIVRVYRLKECIGKPTKYLGADIVEYYFPDDCKRCHWGLSSKQYVNEAIRTVELELSKVGKWLATKASTLLMNGY